MFWSPFFKVGLRKSYAMCPGPKSSQCSIFGYILSWEPLGGVSVSLSYDELAVDKIITINNLKSLGTP